MKKCILVPKAMAEHSLSAQALAAVIWVVAQDSGKIKASSLKARFSWGDKVWRKVSKELREHGILTSNHTRMGIELHFDLEQSNNA